MVTRRTGGRSARVRAAVLTATVDALTEGGVDALNVAAIAERAGVHETSIYRRWGSPSALALDALLTTVGTQIRTPDTGTLRGDLVALLRDVATFVASPLGAELVRLGAREDGAEFAQARHAFWEARLTQSM